MITSGSVFRDRARTSEQVGSRTWIAALFFFYFSFLNGNAFAREVGFEKKVDAKVLQAQLVDAGFKIHSVECSVNHCKIVMPDSEKKDPMPIVNKYVYVDAREIRRKKIAALEALYDKWQTGTITNEEKDLLIKQVVGMALGK